MSGGLPPTPADRRCRREGPVTGITRRRWQSNGAARKVREATCRTASCGFRTGRLPPLTPLERAWGMGSTKVRCHRHQHCIPGFDELLFRKAGDAGGVPRRGRTRSVELDVVFGLRAVLRNSRIRQQRLRRDRRFLHGHEHRNCYSADRSSRPTNFREGRLL
jgi:hypothetical protein